MKKKQEKFADLDPVAVLKKRDELAKELVRFRVSMDNSKIQHESGLNGLIRDLRHLSRKVHIKK